MAKEYLDALIAIIALELQSTPPMIETSTSETDKPVQEDRLQVKATTKRRGVEREITDKGSFHGDGYELVYITAPALAEIMDVTNETARRRLDYFEEKGVVSAEFGERPTYYQMDPDFTALRDDDVRTQRDMITAAKDLLDAARER